MPDAVRKKVIATIKKAIQYQCSNLRGDIGNKHIDLRFNIIWSRHKSAMKANGMREDIIRIKHFEPNGYDRK